MPDSTTPDAAASVLGVSSPKEEDFLIEILKQEKDNIRNSCNVVLAWFALSVGANGTALAELKGPDRPNYMIPLVMLLIATNFTGAYFSWRVGINVDKAIAKIRKITASLFRGSKEREHLAEPSVLYSLWSRALRGFTLAKVAIGIAWCAAVVVAIYSEKFNTHIFHSNQEPTVFEETLKSLKLSRLKPMRRAYQLTSMLPIDSGAPDQPAPPDANGAAGAAQEGIGAKTNTNTENTNTKADLSDEIVFVLKADPELRKTLEDAGLTMADTATSHAKSAVMIVFIAMIGAVFIGVMTAIGWLSDRTRTRWGRRRPWLAWAVVPLILAAMLLYRPPALSATGAAVWFGCCFFALAILSTAVLVPYRSLGPELTSDYRERTTLFGLREGALVVGIVWTVGLMGMLGLDFNVISVIAVRAASPCWDTSSARGVRDSASSCGRKDRTAVKEISRYSTLVMTSAHMIPRGRLTRGWWTSSASLTMSSKPMNA